MEQIEYKSRDKSTWGSGPWQDEPDKVQWPDAETGLPCLAVRGPGGHWCGYVGVANSHPWHGKDYSQCVIDTPCEKVWCDHTPEGIIDVHGGLTFAKGCAKDADEAADVCHVPGAGEPDDVWWFGFDCAHCGDYSPKHGRTIGDEVYRQLAYVQAECRKLAKQLVSV